MKLFEKFDKWLMGSLVLLLIFGVWMMSSVSVYNSYQKTTSNIAERHCEQNFSEQELSLCLEESGYEYAQLWCTEHNCNDLYLSRQIKNIIVALTVMMICFFIPFTLWRFFAPFVFVIAFLLLLYALFTVQADGNTASSWIRIPIVGMNFQPSEAMKLGLALYGALWMEKKKNEVQTIANGFIPFVILVAMSTGLVMIQPDFGSTAILLLMAIAIFWVAGGHWIHFVFAGFMGIAILGIAAVSFPYIRERISTFWNPENAADAAIHQIEQAYLSLGNGGVFGAGDSTQSFGFLPEIQGDMIFAAIGEQVGFLGMIFVVGLYIFITFRGIRISKNAPDRFSMLVAVGLTSWFASQSIINMMVVTGLFPLTGITLPLLSYGGSSLLMTLASMGILLRISTLSYAHTTGRRRNSRTSFSFGRGR